MNLEKAVTIGAGLIRHREEIGAALGSVSRLTGAGFEKIAERFHLPGKISRPISKALDESHSGQTTSGLHLLSSMSYFDADRNGTLSRTELETGLSRLRESGMNTSGQGLRLDKLGEKLLANYDGVARLDGAADGISIRDMGKLLNQDGKIATLSEEDWQKLNA